MQPCVSRVVPFANDKLVLREEDVVWIVNLADVRLRRLNDGPWCSDDRSLGKKCQRPAGHSKANERTEKHHKAGKSTCNIARQPLIDPTTALIGNLAC